MSHYGEKLTKNFRLAEFVCPCCGDTRYDVRLVAALQALRDLAGVPVHVQSGVRCERHNVDVGGSQHSQHLIGKAADIVVEGLHPVEMEELALNVRSFAMGGIGVYPHNGFIHVDVRLTGPARWQG